MSKFEEVRYVADLIDLTAEELDIPETRYVEAVSRYESVGKWLNAEDSDVKVYQPVIYAQGSFALGTIIKPVNGEEYDIDLVCLLKSKVADALEQKELKDLVGNRLKEHEIYKKLLDKEGRRCWTINYKNEFHMDILPCLPDKDISAKGGLFENAIKITDLNCIKEKDWYWYKSNPKGYLAWFKKRQEKVYEERKRIIFSERKFARIEDVPEYLVKTPLQKAVQILKRHRDIYFADDPDNKVISIIITTLAGVMYEGEEDSYNAIYNILNKIDKTLLMKGGKFVIENPSNLQENFADKWNENPELANAFFSWLEESKHFFTDLISVSSNFEEKRVLLAEKFKVKYEEKISKPNFITPKYINTDSHNNDKVKPWKNIY